MRLRLSVIWPIPDQIKMDLALMKQLCDKSEKWSLMKKLVAFTRVMWCAAVNSYMTVKSAVNRGDMVLFVSFSFSLVVRDLFMSSMCFFVVILKRSFVSRRLRLKRGYILGHVGLIDRCLILNSSRFLIPLWLQSVRDATSPFFCRARFSPPPPLCH